jgi:hypothetical protein
MVLNVEYQMYTKCIPKVSKIYQHLPLRDPPKITQIWIFGLKIEHLATLAASAKKRGPNKLLKVMARKSKL